MHDSWRLFGDSLPALRAPALVAGVALIPATYAAGSALYDREAGLLAAALVAGSAPMVEYSVNARGYTLTWLATVLLVAVGARLVARRDPAAWACWIMIATLGLYAVPTMALALFAISAWMALNMLAIGAQRRLVELAVALGITGALVLLFYADVLGQPGWSYVGKTVDDVFGFVRVCGSTRFCLSGRPSGRWSPQLQ